MQRARAKRELGKYKEAIEDYNLALKIDPKYMGSYAGRGKLYLELKDYQKALADFRKVEELGGTRDIFSRETALAKIALRDEKGASQTIEKAKKQSLAWWSKREYNLLHEFEKQYLKKYPTIYQDDFETESLRQRLEDCRMTKHDFLRSKSFADKYINLIKQSIKTGKEKEIIQDIKNIKNYAKNKNLPDLYQRAVKLEQSLSPKYRINNQDNLAWFLILSLILGIGFVIYKTGFKEEKEIGNYRK